MPFLVYVTRVLQLTQPGPPPAPDAPTHLVVTPRNNSNSLAWDVNTQPGVHFNSTGVIDSAFDGLIDELSITDGFLTPRELQPLAVVTTPAEFTIKQTSLSSDGSQLALTFDSTDTRLFTVLFCWVRENSPLKGLACCACPMRYFKNGLTKCHSGHTDHF